MTTATLSHSPAPFPLGQRILRFPLTRLLLALVSLMLPFLLIQAAATHGFDDKLFTRIGQLAGVCVGLVCYGWYVRTVERRPAAELSLKGSVPEFGAGFVLGGSMVCVTVGVLAAVGSFHIRSVSTWGAIVLPLLMHVTVGLIEETMMRGILFRLVQQYLGSWLAIAVSAALFGAMHLINDNITVIGIANIVMVGVLFAAAFMVTGRIWLCVAIHAAWNFFQDGIFSIAVSGHAVKAGLLAGETNGPEWLTGGAFGIEGSAVATGVVVCVTGVLLVMAQRQGRLVQPFWRRATHRG